MLQKLDYPAVGETHYRETLPSGLRLSVAVKPGYTRAFACFAALYGGADRSFLSGGVRHDTPMGVAHYLEHKMFDMPEGDNALSALAANGAQPNAYTASGVTAYHFESTENFMENLRMLLKFVSTPYFTEETVEKERGIIAQEIRMGEDDPDHAVYEELMRSLYAHHPIRDPIAGTVESIAAITPEVLYTCHRSFYHPGNMALAVVGDVDPAAVRETALELLPAEGGAAAERFYGPAEDDKPLRPRFSRAMEVSAPQFMIGAKLSPVPGGNALLRRKILCSLALDYLYSQSSPFFHRLYAEGLLNADFYAGADDAANTMTLFAGGESRDPEAVLAAFLAEADKAANGAFDSAYFRRVKKAGYGSRVRALSSFAGLAGSLADADFGGYNCLDAFSTLSDISEEEVCAFIREFFAPERFAMSVVTPAHGAEAGHA